MSSSSDSISDIETTTVTEIDCSGSSSSEEETGKELKQIKITKEFQENIIKYVKLDDLIKQKQEELTELKNQLKPCEQYILTSLESLNETSIGITNGSIIKKNIEKKSALSPEMIKAALLEKVTDANVVEDIIKLMEAKRTVSVKTDLKRTRMKPTKNRKIVNKK